MVAVNNLVESNLWLVDVITSKFRTYVDYDDYVQVGRIGLIKAARRFNPELGFKFETYATSTIKGEILRYQRDYSRLIKPSRRHFELNYKIYSLKNYGKSDEEICKALKISYSKLQETVKASLPVMSFLDTMGNEDDDISIEETLKANCNVEATVVENIAAKEKLEMLADSISNEYFEIFKLRLTGKSQREIAAVFKCSQMRISRVLAEIKRQYLTISEFYNSEVSHGHNSRSTKRTCAI